MEFNVDTASQATRLIQKRKELAELENEFLKRHEEFLIESKRLDVREQAIKEKDQALQKSLVKFNRYIRENEIKKNRAQAKGLSEIQLQKQISEEIAQLTIESETLELKYDKLKAELKDTSGPRNYLQAVLDAFPHQFTDKEDIMARYHVLKQSHDSVKDQSESLQNATLCEEKLIEKSQTDHFSQIQEIQKDIQMMEHTLTAHEQKKDENVQKEMASDKRLDVLLVSFGEIVFSMKNLKSKVKSSFGKYLRHEVQPTEIPSPDIVQDDLRASTIQTLCDIEIVKRYLMDMCTAVA